MNLINYFFKTKSAIFLFVPLLPLLEIYIKNYYIIDNSEKNYLLNFSLSTFIFFFTVGYVFKNKILFVSSLALIYLISFNYKNITDFATDKALPFISKVPNYAFIFWLLIISAFLIINFINYEKEFYQQFLIIFFIVSVLNSLFILSNSQAENNQIPTINQKIDYKALDEIKFEKTPNIYLLVFDGMANFETAKSYYNFNSETSLKMLKDIGYAVNDYSTSPYGQSLATMGSILNLEYLFDEGIISFSERSNRLESFKKTQTAAYDVFINNNYEIFLMGKIFPCNSNLKNIHCIDSYAYESTSYKILINTPIAIIVNNRSTFPNIYNFISKIFNFSCNPDCGEKTINEISMEINTAEDPTKPNLILLHYMYTHEPFTVKSDCSDREFILYEYPIYNDRAYIDSIECSLKQLQDLDGYLNKSDIVVAMSDHGPFYYSKVDYLSDLTKEDIDNRYKTFLAYKIDESLKCSTNNNFQSVNIFRTLINCLSSSNLELLDVKSYFMSYGTQRGSINYGNENVDLIDINFNEK